jgi:glutamine synthetase
VTAVAFEHVDTVAFAVPDNVGRLIGNRFPVSRYDDLVENGISMPDFYLVTGIDNTPHAGLAVTGLHTGFRNGILRPDVSTLRVLPWAPNTALVLCDALDPDGSPIDVAPRRILQSQVVRLEELGITARCATELEFYLFRGSVERARRTRFRRLTPSYHLSGDHDLLISGYDEGVIGDIRRSMPLAGIAVEASHGEGGPGQHELALEHAPPIDAADRHVVYKHGVKAIAAMHDRAATFMAKVDQRTSGSSCHVHISLGDVTGSAIGRDATSLSEFGSGFLAGLLAFTPELMLLHAPYANSYRRLVEGSWAPSNMTWGSDNRTCCIRCVGRDASFRFEFRAPGADANPYLVLAAVIAAGLEGVRRSSPLPPPVDGDAYAAAASPPLPHDLTEAVALFAASDVAAAAFGTAVRDHFAELGRRELDAVRRAVTNWDLERGFERA